MPIYTYRCDNCGAHFERQQSYQDEPLKTCPECRKKALKRVITPSKIIFKGSGFYATDHKSASGDSSKKPDKKEESKTAESKETKAAEKSESK